MLGQGVWIGSSPLTMAYICVCTEMLCMERWRPKRIITLAMVTLIGR